MAYKLDMIRARAESDAKGFVAECEHIYHKKISEAALEIAGDIRDSKIVLLSGPSGSGKTTTARKVGEALGRLGIGTYAISMDDYFNTVDEANVPRNENGERDFESPYCMDIELLKTHFDTLADGGEILVPCFDFGSQSRDHSKVRPLKLGNNEIAIFEGIHALNDLITERIGGHAKKLYISARSNVEDDGGTVFKGTWIRFVRRVIRDALFRSSPPEYTMSLWEGVRRGEKLFISPFKNKADIVIDSSMGYEVCALRPFAEPLFREVPEGVCRREEIKRIYPALMNFPEIDSSDVPEDSMLREFIGN